MFINLATSLVPFIAFMSYKRWKFGTRPIVTQTLTDDHDTALMPKPETVAQKPDILADLTPKLNQSTPTAITR